MISDEEAVRLAIEGQSDAFRHIIDKYEKPLFVFLYKRIKSKDLALDLLQETFIDAMANLAKLRDADHLSGWLFTIARRKAWLANRQTDDWDEIINPISIYWTPSDEVIEKELLSIVQEAVKKLPEKLGKVVQMHYLDETPYPEICKRLGIPLSTLKSRLHLARKQLHDELSPFIDYVPVTKSIPKKRRKTMKFEKPEIKITEVPNVKMDVELIEPPNSIELRESAKGEFVWFRNEADGVSQPEYLLVRQQVAGRATVDGEECWEIEEELIDPDGKPYANSFRYFDIRDDGIQFFASISRHKGEMTELYFRSETESNIFPARISVGMESSAYGQSMKVDRVVDIQIHNKIIRALETVSMAASLGDGKILRLNRFYFDEDGRNVFFERYHSFDRKPSGLLADVPEIEYDGRKWLLYHYVVLKRFLV